ncbi:AAA family ATPase [Candidatus Saccharibacteria bacterium]|nr:AAA family ATPase [Candidatus Saccharibacteria bacterium]
MKSLSLSKPHVIVMVGIPGSGKSFFAEHFADTFNAPLISDERLRDELFNKPTYNHDEQTIIRRVSDYMLDELYKTHRTFIYDGVAAARIERQEIAKKARAAGYEALFVWVQTESSTAQSRVKKVIKGKTALSPNISDSALKHFSAPHANEKAVVISGKHTYSSQLKIVLKRLVQPRIEIIENQTPPARPTENRTIVVR